MFAHTAAHTQNTFRIGLNFNKGVQWHPVLQFCPAAGSHIMLTPSMSHMRKIRNSALTQGVVSRPVVASNSGALGYSTAQHTAA